MSVNQKIKIKKKKNRESVIETGNESESKRKQKVGSRIESYEVLCLSLTGLRRVPCSLRFLVVTGRAERV